MHGTQGEKTCEEYQSMNKDKVAETEWKYLDVNEQLQQMKNITRSHPDMVGDMSHVTLNFDLSKIPFVHF